jgi:hypothetical protein
MKKLLTWLGIHSWEYKFSNRFDSNYRECKWCGKQQISGYRGYVNINYKIVNK